MFPQIPLHSIAVDLTNTQSISHTVDNILNGSVPPPPSVSPLVTPLSTTHSHQVTASKRAAPVSDVPTSSTTVKPSNQECTTSEIISHSPRARESVAPNVNSKALSSISSKSSADHVNRQDSGVGFSDSETGLRKRTSVAISSQLGGESSSGQSVGGSKTGSYPCPVGSVPDREDSTGSLIDGLAVGSEEHQPDFQEDAYLTLQQRKNNLLRTARRRYLQSHPGTSSVPSTPSL